MKFLMNLKVIALLSLLFFTFSCEQDELSEMTISPDNGTARLTDSREEPRELYDKLQTVLRDLEATEVTINYREFLLELQDERIGSAFEEEINEAYEALQGQTTRDHLLRTEASGSCKSQYKTATFISLFRSTGEARAVLRWSRSVHVLHGWKYRKWSKAKDKKVNAKYSFFYVFPGYSFSAQGRPCQ